MKLLPWIMFLLLGFAMGFHFADLKFGPDAVHAQTSPSMAYSSVYPETFERNDFSNVTAGQTTFQSRVASRANFAMVYLNGILQTPGVDYSATIIPTGQYELVTFLPTTPIQAGDMVTLFYYPK